MSITMHVLEHGFPLCRFTGKPPGQWPLGAIWIRREDYEATAAACRDPEHELHAVMRYMMCTGCERAIVHGPLPDLPIIPTEGRTCEHCKAPLVSTWPAVYCSNECALADAVGFEQVTFTCSRCGRTSYNPNDARESYCGACHAATPAADDMKPEYDFSGAERGKFYRPGTIPRVHVREMTSAVGDLEKPDDETGSDLIGRTRTQPTRRRSSLMGERLTADEIKIVFLGSAARKTPVCPDCLGDLTEGPHGGLSVNWYCAAPECGSRFNFLGPRAELGIERISDAMPSKRSEEP